MSYDFAQLSSLDFEELIRDLLQAETGIRYETFKAGKDQGIDVRTLLSSQKTIVQCKRYIKSDFSKLLSVLEKEELEKIKLINPKRYIIATSLQLSPPNKASIKSVLEPYITTEADILGQEDINNLLGLHPEIEQKHFKLWLSSKAVLDRVLHNAVITQSEQLVDKVRRKIPIFVQNSSFPNALKVINNHRFVIISGEPGVGKTTLAEMLLFSYIEQGYLPIEVKTPRDAYEIYSKEKKIIYYFDDFLGITRLGDKFSNETASYIVSLIELVRNSTNARMILTSREYILVQALQHSERFENSNFLHANYRLSLLNYTRMIKAKILCNHLFFSNLTDEYLEEIISTNTHIKIIEHVNYNPRLIEWMTNKDFLSLVSSKEYPKYFLNTLNQPIKLWEQPFLKQISDPSRHLLLTLFSLNSSVLSSKLEQSFSEFHRFSCVKYNLVSSPANFRDAAKELLGSFLKIERSTLSYINPSVKDFLEYYLKATPEAAIDILESSVFLEQIKQIWNLYSEELSNLNLATVQKFLKAILSAISRLQYNKSLVETKDIKSVFWKIYDIDYDERIRLFINIYEKTKSDEILEAISNTLSLAENDSYTPSVANWAELSITVSNHIESGVLTLDILNRIERFVISKINSAYSLQDFLSVKNAFEEDALTSISMQSIESAFQVFRGNYFSQEYTQIKSVSELEDYLSDFKSLAELFNLNTSNDIELLENYIEEQKDYEEQYADQKMDEWKDIRYEAKDESRAIESMFYNIKDR